MTAMSPARLATITAVPVALVVGVLAFWLLGGFPKAAATGQVRTDAAPMDEATAATCRALVARLPETLGGLHRRPVSAGPEQNAAFGDPAIVLSCGTVGKRAIPQDAQLMGLSDVCWYPEERGEETVWTTVDRQVPLRVVVPAKADGAWLVNLSAPIVATVPFADPGTTHC
ncbi:DUF3515 domain-containing protein [Dactylosporangium aurantiacum]|uniref:DUF3515 domain-containing protein n=2 Tax=Dactylosporangium aurantiacum TaxID=35754 RepID=A0A9Q9MED3_9ACTN|nr:DUF3515 domain-containing protein [Dactylosporangium aurantiacum]UWZ56033.1 DUF3515 domain-containing protein [Dactylosporangium aurantiacum]